jgi:hypothetical protein
VEWDGVAAWRGSSSRPRPLPSHITPSHGTRLVARPLPAACTCCRPPPPTPPHILRPPAPSFPSAAQYEGLSALGEIAGTVSKGLDACTVDALPTASYAGLRERGAAGMDK